jgi:hypothetical protein
MGLCFYDIFYNFMAANGIVEEGCSSFEKLLGI